MQSYTSHFTVGELNSIAQVLEIDTKGKKKGDLDRAIWGFVDDYDKISRGLTYDNVFTNTRSGDFATRFRDWMDARYGQLNFNELSEGERRIWQIRFGLMEINGNSFPGVFEGGPNDRPQEFTQSLREVGAKKSAQAFEQIGKLLFGGNVPSTTKARSNALVIDDDDDDDAFDATLDKCQDLWGDTGEDIPPLCVKFAAKDPERFH